MIFVIYIVECAAKGKQFDSQLLLYDFMAFTLEVFGNREVLNKAWESLKFCIPWVIPAKILGNKEKTLIRSEKKNTSRSIAIPKQMQQRTLQNHMQFHLD